MGISNEGMGEVYAKLEFRENQNTSAGRLLHGSPPRATVKVRCSNVFKFKIFCHTKYMLIESWNMMECL